MSLIASAVFAVTYVVLGGALPDEPECDHIFLWAMNLLPSASLLALVVVIPSGVIALALKTSSRKRAITALALVPVALVVNTVIMLPYLLGVGCGYGTAMAVSW